MNRQNLEKNVFSWYMYSSHFWIHVWSLGQLWYVPFNQIREITFGSCHNCNWIVYIIMNYEFWHSLCKIVRSSVILLLPLFTKTDSLYFETGWESLHSRRHRWKFQLFYKIYNRFAPHYLHDLILPVKYNNLSNT